MPPQMNQLGKVVADLTFQNQRTLVPSSQDMAVEDYLAMSDEMLLRQCRVETFRASGPGALH